MHGLLQWRPHDLAFILLVVSSACLVPQGTPAISAKAWMAQGRQAEGHGNLQEALRDYNNARGLEPANAQASLRIGLLCGRSRDFIDAETSFRRAIAADPLLAEAHYNLGLTLLAKSQNPDWSGALAEFRAALKLQPSYREAANMLGVSLLETGQSALAVPALKSALLLDPASAETHFNLGRALEASGNDAEAYTEYLLAVQHRPAYAEAQRAIANILFAREDDAAALAHLRIALAANPDEESAHYLMAKILRAQRKVNDATIEFRLARYVEQSQSDAIRSTHLSNQALDFAKQEDLVEAVASARQAIMLEPQNALAHFNLSLLLADSGEIQAAILEVRKAISLSPTRGPLYASLGRMQLKLDDRAGAIASLQHALWLDPSDPRSETQLKMLQERPTSAKGESSPGTSIAFPYGAESDTANGHFAFATYLANEGDLPGAVGELLRALSLEPARGDIRYNLAVAYTEMGEYEKAELELRKVILVNARSVEAHIALGTVLLQRKDLPEAATEFQTVLAIEPENRQAPQLLSQCETAVKP